MAEVSKTDGEMLAEMGTDATRWAAEFARAVTLAAHDELVALHEAGRPAVETRGMAERRIGLDPAPGGMLHGVLCSAIEAGRAAGRQGPRLALPADPAGSDDLPADVAATPPADVAGSDLPADPAGRSDVLERLAAATERQAEALEAFRVAYTRALGLGPIPPTPTPGPSRVDVPRAPWQDEAP